ncbi:hypothetical protein Bbelb_049790 [Branchiostoma belcheri]|nr:hypothetical protein Bbelb_049790 [Branchiostoma belcheri]
MASLRAELEAWKRRALADEGKLQRDTVIMVKTKLSPQQVTELQRLCLKTTYFKYEGKFSFQVEGAAMGSPVSPIVANLFMEWFEPRALTNFPNPPKKPRGGPGGTAASSKPG